MSNKQIGIKDIYRTMLVDRFQIVHTHRKQTVAEHQYMVAIITDMLMTKAVGTWEDIQYTAMGYALAHDIPEVVTGDLPTPIKKFVDSDGLHELEKSVGGYYLEKYKVLKGGKLPNFVLRVVKIADMMDSGFFLQQFGYGDHAEKLVTKLGQRVADYGKETQEMYPHYKVKDAIFALLDEFRREPVYIEDLMEY